MNKSIIYIIISILLFGCEQTIEIDVPPHQSRLVLNSVTSTDSLFVFDISKSRGILEQHEANNSINNAEIKIYSGTNLLETIRERNTEIYSDGYYKASSTKVQLGQEYRIEVTAPDYDMVAAQEKTPNKVQINNVEINIDPINIIKRDEGNFYPLDITFSDPSGQKNYYMVQGLVKRVQKVDDNQYIENVLPLELETDDVLIQTENNSNYNSDFLFFLTDLGFDGKEAAKIKLLAQSYVFDNYNESLVKFELQVILQHVSESYYKYMKGKLLQNETDGNPFAEPVQIPNNITGGYGVFGLYTQDIFTKDLMSK